MFETFEEFVAACPFDNALDARRYCEQNPQYDSFGLHKNGVSRYGLRPAGTSIQMPVQPGSLPQGTAPKAPSARNGAPDETREVRNGVKQPRAGSAGEAAWRCHDDAEGDRERAKVLAAERGLNVGNVNTEYRLWAKFNGRT
ncbi:hypothetical protein [Synechococcus phage Ssp-JY38]|nr:hypothetical protein [Synechococcus phage Yong-L2-223]